MVLAEIKPWFTEELTSAFCLYVFPFISFLSVFSTPVHHINDALSTSLSVIPASSMNSNPAASVYAYTRMVSKQVFQAGVVSVVQIDPCRLAGVSEVLAALLMTAKFGMPACPHAGSVGL